MKITVIAGDWPAGTTVTFARGFFGKPSSLLIGWTGGRFFSQHIARAEHVTEQNSTSILGKVGWGAVGGAALGPLGLLAGVIGGGNRNHSVVALELVDGRKALLKCDQEGFAAVMQASHRPAPPVQEDLEWLKDTPEYKVINWIAGPSAQESSDSTAQQEVADVTEAPHSRDKVAVAARQKAENGRHSTNPSRSSQRRRFGFSTVLVGLLVIIAPVASFKAVSAVLKPSTSTQEPVNKQGHSADESAAPAKGMMWVNSDYTERRTCPSLACGIVGTLSRRDAVSALEETSGWVRVSRHYDADCSGGESRYVESGDARCSEANGIVAGQFAEWVNLEALTLIQPPDPGLGTTGLVALVKGSDDFQRFEGQFVSAATRLLADGTCSQGDFTEVGGFSKSSQPGSIYFTYCGGMELRNRLYLDANTGRIFR